LIVNSIYFLFDGSVKLVINISKIKVVIPLKNIIEKNFKKIVKAFPGFVCYI